MARSNHDGSGALAATMVSLVLLFVVAAGAYLALATGGREPPLRTVELSAPLPDIPEPPGFIPEAES